MAWHCISHAHSRSLSPFRIVCRSLVSFPSLIPPPISHPQTPSSFTLSQMSSSPSFSPPPLSSSSTTHIRSSSSPTSIFSIPPSMSFKGYLSFCSTHFVPLLAFIFRPFFFFVILFILPVMAIDYLVSLFSPSSFSLSIVSPIFFAILSVTLFPLLLLHRYYHSLVQSIGSSPMSFSSHYSHGNDNLTTKVFPTNEMISSASSPLSNKSSLSSPISKASTTSSNRSSPSSLSSSIKVSSLSSPLSSSSTLSPSDSPSPSSSLSTEDEDSSSPLFHNEVHDGDNQKFSKFTLNEQNAIGTKESKASVSSPPLLPPPSSPSLPPTTARTSSLSSPSSPLPSSLPLTFRGFPPSFSLHSPHRHLIRSSTLKKYNFSSILQKTKSRNLFLFSDLLLLTTEKNDVKSLILFDNLKVKKGENHNSNLNEIQKEKDKEKDKEKTCGFILSSTTSADPSNNNTASVLHLIASSPIQRDEWVRDIETTMAKWRKEKTQDNKNNDKEDKDKDVMPSPSRLPSSSILPHSFPSDPSAVSRARSGSINISTPFNFLHHSHVNQNFEWQGQRVSDNISIGEVIGKGSFGVVYKCHHKQLGVDCAVKVILIEGKEKEMEEIKKEMDILKLLRHPSIISYYGTFIEDKKLYILMDLCELGALSSLLSTTRTTPTEKQMSYIAYCSLRSLSYLHGKNIVMKDVKPSNMLVNRRGEVKMCDFGVSDIIGNNENGSATSPSKSFGIQGSPLYLSPECAKGIPPSYASDLWALGISLIEIAEGSAPHENENLSQYLLFKKIINGDSPQLTFPIWSGEFRDFVEKCCVKDPLARGNANKLLTHPFILRHIAAFSAFSASTSSSHSSFSPLNPLIFKYLHMSSPLRGRVGCSVIFHQQRTDVKFKGKGGRDEERKWWEERAKKITHAYYEEESEGENSGGTETPNRSPSPVPSSASSSSSSLPPSSRPRTTSSPVVSDNDDDESSMDVRKTLKGRDLQKVLQRIQKDHENGSESTKTDGEEQDEDIDDHGDGTSSVENSQVNAEGGDGYNDEWMNEVQLE